MRVCVCVWGGGGGGGGGGGAYDLYCIMAYGMLISLSVCLYYSGRVEASPALPYVLLYTLHSNLTNFKIMRACAWCCSGA